MDSYEVEAAPPLLRNLTGVPVSADELWRHPQEYFQGSDIVWVMVAASLVLQMIPAISMFYSGATDRSSTLTILRVPFITAAFCSLQWYLWGYVLTFSYDPGQTSWTWYGGRIDALVLNRLVRPVGADGPKIPELLYAFYQGMFAAFTPALVGGGVIKKFKVGRFLVFILLWSLLVYYPVARWTWSPIGLSSQIDSMDFAGGTAVHITSGTAVGAVVLFQELERHGLQIFKRVWGVIRQPKAPVPDAMLLRIRQPDEPEILNEPGEAAAAGGSHQPAGLMSGLENHVNPLQPAAAPGPVHNPSGSMLPDGRPGNQDQLLTPDAPHSLNNLVLGTALLWIGWLGFNGGSALGGNMRAVSACVSTHVAASSGACVMLLLFWALEWYNRTWPSALGDGTRSRKISIVHFCDGAVVGLVAITPAAGYVPVWSAGAIGAIAAFSIFVLKASVLQQLMRQDPLFVFLIHTGGGFIGMFLTGCFASEYVVAYDGYSTIPDRSVAARLSSQMKDAFLGFFYTLGMTLVILLALKLVMRPIAGTWKLVGDDEKDKLEAVPEYKWRTD